MIAVHYGHHEGTTGVHIASALRRRAAEDVKVLAMPRGAYVNVGGLDDVSAYLWVESGERSFPRNLARADCHTAGYLIDVHQHTDLRLLLAPLFDTVFIAQKDFLDAFRAVNENTTWLPLACPFELTLTERAPLFDVGFVGNARPGTRRERLLEALATEFTMNDWRSHHSVQEMGDVYRRSQVVVNDPINGDVNMRFFEGMGSGAVVLSPRIDNGISELAQVGRHYEVADFDDVGSVANVIRRLVSTNESSSMGAAARAHVTRHHTYDARADTIVGALKSARSTAPIRRMTTRARARHLARIADATASISGGLRALTSSVPSPSVAFLSARTVAKAVKRRVFY